MGCLDIPNETVFTMEMTPIKFGPGATDEVAYDLKRLGVRHALIVTDRTIMKLGLSERVHILLEDAGIITEIYDAVHVEPTDQSFEEIGSFVRGHDFDGFVAVGGGSSIDSAKAANLLSTYPAPVMDYINKPIGKGMAVPGPLKPLVALPTTAGTGAETTANAIMDVLALKVKTGISHRYLRPSLAIIDPLNTVTLPPMATAYPGFDVLTHALESYTSRPYDTRPRHKPEEDRVQRYTQGSGGSVPVVAPEGEPCALPTPDSYEWFTTTGKTRAPNWRNQVSLESMEKFLEYNPAANIHLIAPTPLLMVVASNDTLTPTDLAIAAYERALEPKSLVFVKGPHFGAYTEPGLSQSAPPAAECSNGI